MPNPILDLNGPGAGDDGSASFGPAGPFTAIAPQATVSVAGLAGFGGGHLIVSIVAGSSAEDRLTVISQGQIGVSGNTISWDGVVIGHFSGGGDGSTPLDVTFVNANVPDVAVQALVQAIAYANVSDGSDVAPRQIEFDLTDANGHSSAPADVAVTLTSANVVVDLNGAAVGSTGAATFTEGGAPVAIGDLGVIHSVNPLQLMIVEIESGRSGDALSFTGTVPNNLHITHPVDGQFVITGVGTPADYQQVLAGISFSNSTQDPTFNGNSTSREVSVTVGDGHTNASAVTNVQMVAVNDPATIGGTDVGSVFEDIVTFASGQLTISDNDPNESSFQVLSATGHYGSFEMAADGSWQYFSNANESLRGGEVEHDVFTVTSVDGQTHHNVTIEVDGNSDFAQIFPTSHDDDVYEDNRFGIQANGLVAVNDPDAGEHGVQAGHFVSAYGVLDVQTDGNWVYTLNNGSAQVQALTSSDTHVDFFNVLSIDGAASQQIRITIHGADESGGANGPPTAPATLSPTILEDHATAATAIGASDPDGDTLTYILDPALASQPTLGSVAFNQGAGTFIYTPNANANGSDSFVIDTIDSRGNAAQTTVSVTISAVNDAPVGGFAQATIVEDTAGTHYTLSLADFPYTDVEGNGVSAIALTPPPGANILLNGVAANGQLILAAEFAAGHVQLVTDPGAHGDFVVGVQIKDDGGTANAGTDLSTVPGAFVLHVLEVDIPPTGADAHISLNENGSYVLALADFGFADGGAPADNFSGVKFNVLPAGTLTDDGVAVASDQFVSAADIAAGKLVYTPAANVHGTGADHFYFQVVDDGDTSNGGSNLSAAMNLIAFDIQHVNVAPTAPPTNDVTTNEDTTSAPVQIGASDDDGDTLSYALHTGGAPAHGGVTFNQHAGTFTYTPGADYNGADSFVIDIADGNGGVVQQTVDVTVNAVNDAPVVTLTPPGGGYAATEQQPYDLKGTIAVTDVDAGSGVLTATLSVATGILHVDVGTSGATILGDNDTGFMQVSGTLAQLDALFNTDGTSAIVYTVTSDGPPPSGTLTVTVSDNGNSGIDPSATGGPNDEVGSASAVIAITGVNDAPVLSFGVYSMTSELEDAGAPSGAVGTLVSDLVDLNPPAGGNNNVADPDSPAIGIAVTAASTTHGSWFYSIDGGATWQALGAVSATSARLLSATDRLYFQPAADFNGSFGNAITFRAWDQSAGTHGTLVDPSVNGGATAYSTGTAFGALTISSVDDAPVNHVPGAQTLNEDGSLPLSGGSALSISDVDAGSSTLTVTLSVAHGVVTLSSHSGLSFSDPDGDATTTFTGTSSAINAALGSLIYAPTADYNGADVLTITTSDNGHTGADPGLTGGLNDEQDVDSVAITITAVNDAPVLDAAANVMLTAEPEDAGAPSGAVGTLVSLLVDLSPPAGGLDNVADVDSVSIGIAVTGANTTNGTYYYSIDGGASWQVLGAVTNASALLLGPNDRIWFQPNGDFNGTTSDAITFRAWDQSAGTHGTLADTSANGGATAYSSATDTGSLLVAAVNDAPVNTPGGTVSLSEDGGPTALTGISVSDVDAGAGNLTVTLSVQHGTLSIATNVGGGILAGNITGGANGSATITITGTEAQINATLADAAGLTYAAAPNYNGGDALHIVTSDNGNSGSGGILTDTDDRTIIISAVSDPVTTAAPATLSLAEDSGATAVSGLSISDVDAVLAPNGVYEVTLSSAHGALTLTTLAGLTFTGGDGTADASMTFHGTLSAINTALATATYAPTADYAGSDQIGLSATDSFGGIVATGSGSASSDSAAVAVTVTPVNDAPVNSVPGAQTINEDSTLTLSGGNAISVADIDVGAGTLTVTLSVAHGVLTLASHSGLTFTDNDGDAITTFSGTVAAINTALDGLVYAPTANYEGSDTLTVTTNDNGNSGTPGALQDVDAAAITVTAINDAPSGADHHVTDIQDSNYVFQLSDFGFSDPADGNNFNAVSILGFPAHGTLFLDVDGPGGSAPIDLSSIGSGVFVGVADIIAGHLYFTPEAGAVANAYASFTFEVQDDGGIANGGVDLDPTPNTITIDLVPSNNPPVVDLNTGTAGNNDTNTYQEGGSASTLGAAIAVSDPDNDQIAGATVTITNAQAGDQLVVSLPLPGGIVVQSNAGGVLVLTGTASASAYQDALGRIGYQNSGDDPTAGGHTSRTIDIIVNDGQLDSAAAVMTMTVVAVDDPAVARADAVSTNEASVLNGNVLSNNGSGADSDVDGPALSVSAVNGSAANVGHQITLDSGAHLTLNANGTFSYDPNHAFDATPTAGSGAANAPAHDSFTYTLANGGTATVSVSIAGLDGNDTLHDSTAAPATLIGGTGNDIYDVTNTGDSVIEHAGEGNDRIVAGVSYTLSAGQEIETLITADTAGTAPINLAGNALAQVIIGNEGANTLTGGGGSDYLIGLGGDDTLFGNADAASTLQGGTGNDTYYIVRTGDSLVEFAGEGNDRIVSTVSYTLSAGQEVENLFTADPTGTTAIDFAGNASSQNIFGNAGNNTLTGGGGHDLLVGGGGDDTLFGNADAASTLQGGTGNDTYFILQTGDSLVEFAGEGNDRIISTVSYTLSAGVEVETLAAANQSGTSAIDFTGNEISQLILGNGGVNSLSGGGGDDTLSGLGGSDVLLGGSGNDQLNGGAGSDVLNGGSGADQFVFADTPGPNNVDQVQDFVSGQDRLLVDHNVFAGLSTGVLAAGAFVTGTTAQDADDRFIYDSTTGNLWFDADGNGAGAAVLFATLQGHPALAATDIAII